MVCCEKLFTNVGKTNCETQPFKKHTLSRSISSSDKKAERSEKPSSSGNSLVRDLGDLLTGGISSLNVGEVCGVGGVVGSSGEGLGADVEGAEQEGVLGSSGEELGAKLEGVVGSSAEGLGADVEGAELEGVVGSSGEELGADVVGAGLEGVVGSSAGGIGSFSEDRVMLIGV